MSHAAATSPKRFWNSLGHMLPVPWSGLGFGSCFPKLSAPLSGIWSPPSWVLMVNFLFHKKRSIFAGRQIWQICCLSPPPPHRRLWFFACWTTSIHFSPGVWCFCQYDSLRDLPAPCDSGGIRSTRQNSTQKSWYRPQAALCWKSRSWGTTPLRF